MNSQPKKIKLIGRREYVNFPLFNIEKAEAKIDTGAYTCAIDCKEINIDTSNQNKILSFKLFNNKTYQVTEFTKKKIKNSFGEIEERFIIKTLISIGKKRIRSSISLSERGNMRYPVLIGRKLLKHKFIVDVNLIYTNGINLNKYITDYNK
jgi:hypothetical protein